SFLQHSGQGFIAEIGLLREAHRSVPFPFGPIGVPAGRNCGRYAEIWRLWVSVMLSWHCCDAAETLPRLTWGPYIAVIAIAGNGPSVEA
ncbi:MAG TPA: hypothetical protein VF213_00425, partial [Dongiaceae bacterium]